MPDRFDDNQQALGTPAAEGWRGVIYVLPLFLALFATVFSPHKPLENVAFNTILDKEWYRTYMFGGIYLFAFILVLCRPVATLRLARSHVPYLLFLVYVIWSATWSGYPFKVFVTWGHFMGFYLICLAAVQGVGHKEKGLYQLMLIYGALALVGTLVLVALFPERGIVMVGTKLRWIGFTNSANILGAMMLLVIWASEVSLYYVKRFAEKALLVAIILLALVCLHGSDSMTSMLLAIGTLVLLPLLMKIGRLSTLKALLAVISMAIAAGVGLIGVYVVNPDILVKKNLLSNLTLIGRSATFTGRTGLWETALRAVQERPFSGWSFDALFSVGDRFIIRAAHFHNGYLELLVSGGVVGLLLVLGITAHLVFSLVRLQQVNGRLWAGLTMLLLLILLHNLAEASLGRTPTLLWLIFTLLYVFSLLPENNDRGHLLVRQARI